MKDCLVVFTFYDESLRCFIHCSRSGCKVMLHDHVLFFRLAILLLFVLFLTCIVAVFVHFLLFFISHPPPPLPIWSLTQACSIGLPSHHDRQLYSTTMHSENERDPPRESVPSPSGVSSTRMSYLTSLPNISSFAQLACRTCSIVGFIASAIL